MGAFIKLIDAALFLYFVVIALAVPLIDGQTILPLDLYPKFLIDLKRWFFTEIDHYLVFEMPHFYAGIAWCELLFQWPVSLMCVYGIVASKSWFKTTCLIYGSSFLTSLKFFHAFSRICRDVEKIQGILVARGAPRICHIFFADDTLLLGHATLEEAQWLRFAIQLYGKVSVQQINLDKFGVFFSPNTHPSLVAAITQCLGIPRVISHDKYLGLSTVVDGVLHEIQQLAASYWCGEDEGQRKIQWVAWDRMARSKSLGGLGFCNFKAFNPAMLSKQAWRILTNQHSLLERIYKDNIVKDCVFLSS